EAAAVLADPKNQPVYFHCHHGINRASMVQMAYRTKYCGWTLRQATDEISRTFGLVEVHHGPAYPPLQAFYPPPLLPSPPPTRPPRRVTAAPARADTAGAPWGPPRGFDSPPRRPKKNAPPAATRTAGGPAGLRPRPGPAGAAAGRILCASGRGFTIISLGK